MRIAAVTLLALLALAAPAAAKTEVASSGDLRAELSYTEHKNSQPTGLVARVLQGGEEIVRRVSPDKDYLSPLFKDAVVARDLDGDGAPEALFSLFTGGAHCCVVTFLYQGTTEIETNWGNPGYVLRDFDGDGVPEFETGDDRFNYRYGSYAGSLPPLGVFRLVGGELTDVTREPSVRPALRKEAARFKRLYKRYVPRAKKQPVFKEILRSSLAAFTADECSLGDCAKGYALVEAAQARGALSGFLARVKRDMRDLGYDEG